MLAELWPSLRERPHGGGSAESRSQLVYRICSLHRIFPAMTAAACYPSSRENLLLVYANSARPCWHRHQPRNPCRVRASAASSCSSPARYKDRYFGDTLAKLDPRQVVLELQHLAGEAEPVLLCYEHPPPSPSWCHRALVSVWLFDTLGLVVPELGHEHRGHGRAHPKLHPTL